MLGFDRKTPWSVFGPWRFMGISGIHRQSWVSWSSSRLSWYETTYSITTLLLMGCQMEVHRYPFIPLGGEGQRVEDPAWSRTQTSRLGVQRANLKATKSPQLNGSLNFNLIWTITMNIRKTLCRFTLRKPRQALMTTRAPFHKICKKIWWTHYHWLLILCTCCTIHISMIVFCLSFQIQILPYVCGVREGFIDNFLRLLDRKALALIKYVETQS